MAYLQISVFLKDDGPHWRSSWLAGALDPQCGVGPSGAQSAQCQQSPKRLDEEHRHGVDRFAGFAKQGSHQLDPLSHGHNDQQNQYLHIVDYAKIQLTFLVFLSNQIT
jgi:hypothetical protein